MIKNSTLQNDLIDTFSLYTKVNDVCHSSHPIVYNFFSLGGTSAFIKKDRYGDYLVCYTGLNDLDFLSSYSHRQYEVFKVTSDYTLAVNFFRGLVSKILKDLP